MEEIRGCYVDGGGKRYTVRSTSEFDFLLASSWETIYGTDDVEKMNAKIKDLKLINQGGKA